MNQTPRVFVLAPDAEFARGLRRHLAEATGSVLVRVGTWLDLIEQCRSAYLIGPDRSVDANLKVAQSVPDAFWKGSLAVDPSGVMHHLLAGWRTVRCGSSPLTDWASPTADNSRIAERLHDLQRLQDSADFAMPDDLRVILEITRKRPSPLKTISVIISQHVGYLDEWQKALLQHLRRDSRASAGQLEELVAAYDGQVAASAARSGSTLRAVQDHLFTENVTEYPGESSFSIAGVRDAWESVDVTLTAIQHRLKADPALRPNDFGILLVGGSNTENQLHRVAARYSLPIANAERSVTTPDYGAEAIKLALMGWSDLIPITAAKSLLTNPLMPWSDAVGRELAASLDDRRWGLRFSRELPRSVRSFAEFLLTGLEVQTLPDALHRLIETLDVTQDEHCAARTREVAANVLNAFTSGIRDWDDLITQVSVGARHERLADPVYQDGITILREGHLPWRPVRHLFVLDFVDGHFPTVTGLPQIFSISEWTEIVKGGLRIELPRDSAQRARQVFKSQLKAASDSVTILIPRRDTLGKRVEASSSLYDIAALFGDANDAESLVHEIETETGRKHMSQIPAAVPPVGRAPRMVEPKDLRLQQNLLRLNCGEGDAQRPLSPSAMDKMLVSPVGWLLAQLGAEPGLWEPEDFSPGLTGSAAHAVFETLFPVDRRPIVAEIRERTRPLFVAALKRLSPYLLAPQFKIEREYQIGQIQRAAERWLQILETLDASVIEPEIWLQGTWQKLPIHGQADAVIDIPDAGLVIVDFKNSSHKKYFARMESGMDLQASMYRTMMETGAPKPRRGTAVVLPENRPLCGILYFTLRDGTVSADFQPAVSMRDWRSTSVDVAEHASKALKARVRDATRGCVRIPRKSELDAWADNGVPMFAIDASPLTQRLLIDDSGDKA